MSTGTKTLVAAFLSHLYYCNSLLSGCPQHLVNKLYLSIYLYLYQNNAAGHVPRAKTAHISPHLASFHWLPVDWRIQCKLAATTASTRPVLATCLKSLQFTSEPHNYALFLILPFFVFTLCACTCLFRCPFLMLHRLSGTVSVAKLARPSNAPIFSSHLWNLTYQVIPLCVCVCVCVCGVV